MGSDRQYIERCNLRVTGISLSRMIECSLGYLCSDAAHFCISQIVWLSCMSAWCLLVVWLAFVFTSIEMHGDMQADQRCSHDPTSLSEGMIHGISPSQCVPRFFLEALT